MTLDKPEVIVIKPGDIAGQLGSTAVVVTASETTEVVRIGGKERRFRGTTGGQLVEERVARMRVETPPGGERSAFLEFEGRAPVSGMGKHTVVATLEGTVWSGKVGGSATLSTEKIIVRKGE